MVSSSVVIVEKKKKKETAEKNEPQTAQSTFKAIKPT